MNEKHFSIKKAFSWSAKTFIDNIVFLLLLSLAFLGIVFAITLTSGLLMVVSAKILPEDSPLLFVLAGVLLLVLSALLLWLMLGTKKAVLDIYDHGKAEFKTLFSQGKLIIPFATANFLYLLLVVLGAACFIIPGIYFACRFFFFGYAMVDKKLGVLESFQESSRLTEGARWQILGLSIITLFLNRLPFLVPLTMLAGVYAYRKQQVNTLHLPATIQEK